MRKKVLFIGMLVTLLFAFSGCGTKNEGVVTLIMSDVQEGDHPTAQANLQISLRKEQTEKLS